jgi:hypothetical protein
MASFPPPDVVHQILDDLDGDQLSLRACALVHSSWALASQARLFHTVAIDQPEKWRALVHLSKTTSHIRPLLRRLYLVMPQHLWNGHLLQDNDFVEPLQALFPHANHVTQRRGALMDALFRRLPSFVSLELLGGVVLDKDTTLSPPCSSLELGRALMLQSLVVTGVFPASSQLSVPEWIQMRVHVQSLRRLRIALPRTQYSPAHRRMYEALTALEELTLDVFALHLENFGSCSPESRLRTVDHSLSCHHSAGARHNPSL